MFHGDKFKQLSLGSVSKGWEVSQLQHIGTVTRERYWGISWSAIENKAFYQETASHNLSYMCQLWLQFNNILLC